MKTINLAHEIFIREMMAGNQPQHAYLAAYPNAKATTLRSAPYRLLARPDVSTRLTQAYQEKWAKVNVGEK